MAEVLGDAVTPAVAEAWAYWLFATQLIAEDSRRYQQAGIDADRQPRQYAVCPTASETRLQITVSRRTGVDGAPDGQVSSYLHDVVRPGDLLNVSNPPWTSSSSPPAGRCC